MIGARQRTRELDSSTIKNSIANDSRADRMQISCSHVTASAETHCVIPMRVQRVPQWERLRASFEFPSLAKGKRKVDIPRIAAKGVQALSFGRNPSAFCAWTCAPHFAHYRISSLMIYPQRHWGLFSRDQEKGGGERLLTIDITKKRKWLVAENFAIYRHYW